MATIVLVHGGLVGSWCWKRLTPLLRAAGHEVYAPSLTGLGERAHLAHPGITLDTHITDIANVLFYEDLIDVTLVGWNYGGMVIAGVAERIPERVRQLVFLDSPIPVDGQSAYDFEDIGESQRAEDWATTEIEGRPGIGTPPILWMRLHLPPEADPAWISARMTPHPLTTLSQPMQWRSPAAMAIPRAYIICMADKTMDDPMVEKVMRLKQEPGWTVCAIPAEHAGPMVTPHVAARALLSLIDG